MFKKAAKTQWRTQQVVRGLRGNNSSSDLSGRGPWPRNLSHVFVLTFLLKAALIWTVQASAGTCESMFSRVKHEQNIHDHPSYIQYKSKWDSISRQLPKNDVPYFAIGTQVALNKFVPAMMLKTRWVVYSASYWFPSYEYWGGLGVRIGRNTEKIVSEAHETGYMGVPTLFMRLSPETRNVLVVLDDIRISFRPKHGGFSPTSREILNLLRSPELLARSRWYRDGIELSFDEIFHLYLEADRLGLISRSG